MPKGGARARSGPAPDPAALARDRDGSEWISLSQGHDGPVPDWPLVEVTDRESVVWESVWALPQAVMWSRQHQELEVAMYVRQLAVAEAIDAPTMARTLLRQMGDSLGLTTPGLRSHRWRIEPAEVTVTKPVTKSKSRARLKVVAPDAVEGSDLPG